MELEKQVCTREQGKRLTELGIKAKTYFMWVFLPEQIYRKGSQWLVANREFVESVPDIGETIIAANAAELAAMLPMRVLAGEEEYFLHCLKGSNGWLVEYRTNKKDISVNIEGELDRPRKYLYNTYVKDYNLAKCFAEWLIILFEFNLLTAEYWNIND